MVPFGELPSHTEISTHALREEGDWTDINDATGTFISTHALREEGDF